MRTEGPPKKSKIRLQVLLILTRRCPMGTSMAVSTIAPIRCPRGTSLAVSTSPATRRCPMGTSMDVSTTSARTVPQGYIRGRQNPDRSETDEACQENASAAEASSAISRSAKSASHEQRKLVRRLPSASLQGGPTNPDPVAEEAVATSSQRSSDCCNYPPSPPR